MSTPQAEMYSLPHTKCIVSQF